MERIYGAADHIHQEFPSVSPKPSTEEESKTSLERVRRYNKLMVLGAIAMSALSMGMGGLKGDSGHRSSAERVNSPAVLTLQQGEKINFLDFARIQPQQAEQITPDGNILKLINNRDPFFKEIGLDPNNINNPNEFSKWVDHKIQTSEGILAMGVSPDQMSAKQLVEASALLTAENLKYSWDANKNAQSDKLPMDKILMEHLPAECETYAATQQAVFNVLKNKYPDKLANTYLIENSIESQDVMHYVNAVVQVESPTEVSIAFSDPTALDVSAKIRHGYLGAENASTLKSGLGARGISSIDNQH